MLFAVLLSIYVIHCLPLEVTIRLSLFPTAWSTSKLSSTVFTIELLIGIIIFLFFSDLLQNPLIVPLKKLQTHEKREEFGVLDVVWHPVQPWILSTGADATIRLYT